MMPLFFAERLVLESLMRGAKKAAALAADTGLSEGTIDALLKVLGQKNLIQEFAQSWQINLEARDDLIKLLRSPRQYRTAVEDVVRLIGQAKGQGIALRFHLKKAYLNSVQQTYLDQLLQHIEDLFDEVAQEEIPHDLKDETIFIWGSATCGELLEKPKVENQF